MHITSAEEHFAHWSFPSHWKMLDSAILKASKTWLETDFAFLQSAAITGPSYSLAGCVLGNWTAAFFGDLVMVQHGGFTNTECFKAIWN